MGVEFSTVEHSNLDDQRWLRWLDASVFPIDIPYVFETSNWFIGFDGGNAVAYCAWKPHTFGNDIVGFHYRSGVMPSHRGQGLQKQMIGLREAAMKNMNLTVAVTYTETYSAASMCSLISAGYRPYEATDKTALTGLDRYKRFVHWQKSL